MVEIDLNALAEYIYISKINLCSNYNEWVAIAFAIASKGPNYESAFLKIASVDSKYKEMESRKLFRNALRKSGENTLGALINACKLHGVDYTRFYEKREWEYGGKPEKVFIPAAPKVVPKLSTTFLDVNLVTKSQYSTNNLIQFLASIFDKRAVDEIAHLYKIGSYKNGSTIFWQIDTDNKIRSGKIIQYDLETGHRVKTYGVNWVHSLLKKRGRLPDNYELQQCLFGSHLLPMFPHETVVLVESEKTALIYSLFNSSVLSLATGGLSNLKPENVSCLKGRSVLVLPDLDAYENWKVKINRLNQEIAKLNLHLSDAMFQIATEEDIIQKKDIADLIIQWVQYRKATNRSGNQENILRRMCEKNPSLELLIDSFGLELYKK